MAVAKIILNQPQVILTAHRLAGPHIRRTSNLIINGARRLVPRGDHMSGSGRRRSGTPLAASLHIRTITTVTRITERIGSHVDYATSMHQGSSAHDIESKGRMLRFRWERGSLQLAARAAGRIRGRRIPRSRGGYFYFVRVRHPGNKRPVRYLTTPMHLFGRANGFRTTSSPVSRSPLP